MGERERERKDEYKVGRMYCGGKETGGAAEEPMDKRERAMCGLSLA